MENYRPMTAPQNNYKKLKNKASMEEQKNICKGSFMRLKNQHFFQARQERGQIPETTTDRVSSYIKTDNNTNNMKMAASQMNFHQGHQL